VGDIHELEGDVGGIRGVGEQNILAVDFGRGENEGFLKCFDFNRRSCKWGDAGNGFVEVDDV
jgi:hypothetical protein